jgi:hypothetical protein
MKKTLFALIAVLAATGAHAGFLKDAARAAADGAAQGVAAAAATITQPAATAPASDIPPALYCKLVGADATAYASMRARGMTEVAGNTAVSQAQVSPIDPGFQVRALRVIYTVYHDDRYQRGMSPEMVGAMMREDCLDRLPAYERTE